MVAPDEPRYILLVIIHDIDGAKVDKREVQFPKALSLAQGIFIKKSSGAHVPEPVSDAPPEPVADAPEPDAPVPDVPPIPPTPPAP